MTTQPKIGFIGQGFIGKHMADDFEARGFSVVRYAVTPEYIKNKAALATCAVVFVAVPAPTTPAGYDDSNIRSALSIPEPGSIVVIKSTVPPGHTKYLQTIFPKLILLHAPEFLREKHAATDTAAPERNIIGVPAGTDQYHDAAELVLALLPTAPDELVWDTTEAELIKYGGNGFLLLKLVYMNMLHDLALEHGVSYDMVKEAMAADSRIGASHMNVIDSSGHPGASPGRGAGGHCFPKDWAVLESSYTDMCGTDNLGHAVLAAVRRKNLDLLQQSRKDSDIITDIYGG